MSGCSGALGGARLLSGDGLTGRLVVAAAIVGTLGLAGSGSAEPRATPPCRPTQSQGAGPFQSNHTAAPQRSRIGRGHVLTGRVLRYPDCAPVSRAVVELWQESPNGRYDRRGHASVATSRAGTFRFEGPVPPSGFGRPPHIHVRVSAGGYEDAVTTYVLARGEQRGRITIVLVSSL
jgi:protocatechuate 3,4-dioxygenase beta subunit